jgi:16S rRNA (guanine527-N7)-methyltransferase
MTVDQLASPGSLEKLRLFVRILDRWRKVTNLISEDDFRKVWERHILDSIYLLNLFPAKRRWLDIGSGAGFPGIVLGIMLAEDNFAQVHCVESDGRKCTFLRSAVQQLQIPVKIHNRRAEGFSFEGAETVEVVTARALSSIGNIIRLSEEFMRAGAILVLPRGKTSTREVEALDISRYTSTVHVNPLAVDGIFLQIQLRAGRRQ